MSAGYHLEYRTGLSDSAQKGVTLITVKIPLVERITMVMLF